ncbi:MAG: hypothetical protein ACLRZ9_01565 [Eubacterium sp.]
MSTSTIIIGIILFAIATMIIYGWGLVRQKNQTEDLMRMLFSKGESRVKKYLRNNEYITTADVEKICGRLEAKQPFSSNRAVVKDKNDFANKLLAYMTKTGQLEQEGNRYKKVKR